MSAPAGRVARAFARSMATYDGAAVAQGRIAARLFAAYRRAAGGHRPVRVLEAGYGSGHLTRHLLGLRPARLWLNDLAAPRLAGVAAAYLPGDVAAVALPGGMDLAASASMIQWAADPARVMARLAGAVAPGGWLAVSGFAPGHFPELRGLGSRAAAPSYLSGAQMAALLPAGWQMRGAGDWRMVLHFPDALAVLRHLRATGVNGCAGHIRSAGALRDFLARYETRHGGARGLPLTYIASWLVARKG